MEYVDITKLFDTIQVYINDEELNKIEKTGFHNSVVRFIYNTSPDRIEIHDGKMYVSDELNCSNFAIEYLKKNNNDYSAKDIAEKALHGFGLPPIENMSAGSLEKKIRTVIQNNEFKDNIYFKRIGNKETVCVDAETAHKICSHPDVVSLIKQQIKKAEKTHNDTPDWRTYEEEKSWVEFQSKLFDNDDTIYLSQNDELFFMIKALFELFFTSFDVEKYNSLYNEWDCLEQDRDFGIRYQTLKKIFNTPNFDNEFFRFEPKDDVLDVLADKIAEKVLKKLEKGS